MAVVKNGNSEPGTSVIAPKLQYYKGNDPYPYDIEKAKSLLAEAGYPDGFKTTLIFANTSANMKQGEFLKQQLAEVGIDVELISLESAIVNERSRIRTLPAQRQKLICTSSAGHPLPATRTGESVLCWQKSLSLL